MVVEKIPFHPVARDFEGFPMPSSVPPGMRLELSRAPIVPGKEAEFQEWMDTINYRYPEHQEALSNERQLFEATFRSTEADGSTWIYHVSLMGSESAGLDASLGLSAEHAAYSGRVKQPGWEELTPLFMLTPDHIQKQMIHWAATGRERE
jgi:hypothetical protein